MMNKDIYKKIEMSYLVAYLLRHVRACDTHSNTDVGLLERGRVVDTITSDGHDSTQTLATFHDDQLLLW